MDEPSVASLQQVQHQFCQSLRHPEQMSSGFWAQDRLQIYRNLLLNNVCSFIDLVYPVARTLIPTEQWQSLCEEFFAQARCESPFYRDISLQFREYLNEAQHEFLQRYPWLAELLQYEWLELYVDSEMIDIPVFDSTLADSWQLKHQIWVLVYQYPVYTWTTVTQHKDLYVSPSAIMVWRNGDDEYCLHVLSPIQAIVLDQLKCRALTESQIFELIAQHCPMWSTLEIQQQINELKNRLDENNLRYIAELRQDEEPVS